MSETGTDRAPPLPFHSRTTERLHRRLLEGDPAAHREWQLKAPTGMPAGVLQKQDSRQVSPGPSRAARAHSLDKADVWSSVRQHSQGDHSSFKDSNPGEKKVEAREPNTVYRTARSTCFQLSGIEKTSQREHQQEHVTAVCAYCFDCKTGNNLRAFGNEILVPIF